MISSAKLQPVIPRGKRLINAVQLYSALYLPEVTTVRILVDEHIYNSYHL